MPRQHARAIFQAALDAVRPEAVTARAAAELNLGQRLPDRIFVIGGGKAGAGMVAGIESALGDCLDRVSGIVNVPDLMARQSSPIRLHASRPSGVNEPTEAAAAGVAEMLAVADQATPNDAVIVLLSGGGSALLPAPADGITLADKIEVTRLLSAAGADIRELNCVRKHLSRIKGGRLAERLRHVRSVDTLIVSDVVGDPLDVIASGPTVADPTTFRDAGHILEVRDLLCRVPPAVVRYLDDGIAGLIEETPKQTPANVRHRIIANNDDAIRGAEVEARQLGYEVTITRDGITGKCRDVATRLAAEFGRAAGRPRCILMGGETTVSLGQATGLGGRNQEFVLVFFAALESAGLPMNGLTLLSGGTDGEDGPTDAAGAVCDASIHALAMSYGDPTNALTNHDSYHWFDRAGGLVRTGLTGTNVMDVRILLLT
ncbi:MAG: DUF4147 domain-containing protein [Gemmataceae bacterium]|nr:DUF4147 domain-containing protein [Gemmataceae bacterium]